MNESTHVALQAPLTDQQIIQLAPVDLRSYRTTRYQADDICVLMEEFKADDQQVLRQLYAMMSELLSILQASTATPKETLSNIQDFVRRSRWSSFIQSVRELGRSTDTWKPTGQMLKVLHDFKGGSFVAASVTLQMMEHQMAEEGDVQRLFFVTRDYLKIMRTGVYDLDPQGYAKDRLHKMHSAQLLVDKWQESIYRTSGSAAKIVLDARFTGNISERCLEFAAVDRIIYNLINNAAKNTTDNMIYVSIVPLPENEPTNARFVIYNRIFPNHQHILTARYGDNLGALFQGGFTTGGTGLGMRICGDLVASAYGLASVKECLERGYIGATYNDDYFVNWFHWPIAGAEL